MGVDVEEVKYRIIRINEAYDNKEEVSFKFFQIFL